MVFIILIMLFMVQLHDNVYTTVILRCKGQSCVCSREAYR